MTKSWLETVAQVESMIPLLGSLGREKNVTVQLAGHELLANSVTSLMTIFEQYPAYDVIDIKNALVELQHSTIAAQTIDLDVFLIDSDFISSNFLPGTFLDYLHISSLENNNGSTPVVLYGFGRIGRLLTRRLCRLGKTNSDMTLAAIVVRKKDEADLRKRANLLKFDSVHGEYDGMVKVDVDQQALIINGHTVKVIYASHPSEVDYQSYDIDNALLVDNTGLWRDADALDVHLQCAGIERVLLTAPGKQMKNVVFGVNDVDVVAEDRILSAASCTTNAIAPILSVLEESYGIESGHVETIHAYTNDQNLIDNIHKGDRRGRAAALNMVITETGAAKAVAKAIPSLEGKLSGSAIRVPVINVSIAVLNLTFQQEVSVASIHELLHKASQSLAHFGQIGFSENPDAVSSDFIGSEQAGILDSLSTKVQGKQATLYVWYDNEHGYSCQVVRLMERLASLAVKTSIETDAVISSQHRAA